MRHHPNRQPQTVEDRRRQKSFAGHTSEKILYPGIGDRQFKHRETAGTQFWAYRVCPQLSRMHSEDAKEWEETGIGRSTSSGTPAEFSTEPISSKWNDWSYVFRYPSAFRLTQTPQGSRGTDALRACGFVVTSEHGEHRGPTSHLFNIPGSRAEMMEMMVFLIKRAYSPGRVNVAVWDAEMDVDVAKFCGLEECGTAISGTGLAYTYRFAVFRGVGQVKWTGESQVALAVGETEPGRVPWSFRVSYPFLKVPEQHFVWRIVRLLYKVSLALSSRQAKEQGT